MIRSWASSDAASFEDESKSSHFLRRWLGCREHGLLELAESLLQLGVPPGAMDFPVSVGPFAHARVVPFLNADTLIPGSGIINLLVVDGAVLDHGFNQSMAKAGTISGACFRHEGSIGVFGGTAHFRGFGKQDFASDLHQPFA